MQVKVTRPTYNCYFSFVVFLICIFYNKPLVGNEFKCSFVIKSIVIGLCLN